MTWFNILSWAVVSLGACSVAALYVWLIAELLTPIERHLLVVVIGGTPRALSDPKKDAGVVEVLRQSGLGSVPIYRCICANPRSSSGRLEMTGEVLRTFASPSGTYRHPQYSSAPQDVK